MSPPSQAGPESASSSHMADTVDFLQGLLRSQPRAACEPPATCPPPALRPDAQPASSSAGSPTLPLEATAPSNTVTTAEEAHAFPGGAGATLEDYLGHRQEITDLIRKNGSAYFMQQAASGMVGLVNQGATCYLNSLLQTLYMTREFRDALFRWQYSAHRDGPKETCIPYQLQALFARLQLSKMAAVSTKSLTASFGWNNSEVFQQHDIQELCQVLFEALEKASEDLGRVLKLYEGRLIDYIQDVRWPEEGVRRVREEPFTGVQLEVQNMGSLKAALHKYVEPEQMEGDNQWQCDDDGTKVDARKGLAFRDFPPHLMLHLRRFMYDWNVDRRVKLNDPLSFPSTMDLRTLLQTAADGPSEGAPPGTAAAATGLLSYALYAILIHSGTANSGHYVAYIQDYGATAPVAATAAADIAPGWFHFNDAVVSPLSTADLRAMMGVETQEAPETGAQDALADDSSSVMVTKRGPSGNAYMLLYRLAADPGHTDTLEGHKTQPPAEVVAEIEEENARFLRLQALHTLGERVAELHVYDASDPAKQPHVMHVIEHTLLSEVAEALAKGSEDHALGVGMEARLRRYNPLATKPGETYGGKEGQSMKQLGLAPRADLLWETREAADPPFREFNPNEFSVQVALWDPQACAEVPNSRRQLVVPGEQEATLAGLRGAVEGAFGVPEARQWLAYVDSHYRICQLLAGDGATTLLHSGLAGGENLLLQEATPASQCEDNVKQEVDDMELCTSDDEGGAAAGAPPLMPPPDSLPMPHVITYHQEKQNTAEIMFNSPEEPHDFSHVLKVDLRKSLGTVKAMIAERLGVDAGTIHARRNVHAPQLQAAGFETQDESLTLKSLGFVEQSILFIGRGAPRKVGSVLLKLSLYLSQQHTRPFRQLCELDMLASSTVQELKEAIARKVTSLGDAGPLKEFGFTVDEWGGGAEYVRVRDRRGAEAGKVLVSDRTLRQALPKLADGKEVAVQLLGEPEVAGPDDMLLLARQWLVGAGTLGKPREVLVKRTLTNKELRALLAAKFELEGFIPASPTESAADADGAPMTIDTTEAGQDTLDPTGSEAEGSQAGICSHSGDGSPADPSTSEALATGAVAVLGLAKGSMFGPPLTVPTVAKLNWNADLAAPDTPLVQAPLALRDGGLVMVRSEAEVFTATADQLCGSGVPAPPPPPPYKPHAKPSLAVAKKDGRAANQKHTLGKASAHREQGINIHVFNSQDNLLVHDESEPMIDGETSTVGALVVHSAALEVPVNDDLDTT